MAFNQILAMLSQHLSLEDELHIYPLTSLHHLHKVLPNLPEIEKYHIHALLHQVGALKFRNGDVKPVNKMQGLKELLVDLGSI